MEYIVYNFTSSISYAWCINREVALNKTSQLAQVLHFIGDPIVALLIATIYSFFSLGYAKGFSKDKVLQFTNDCLGPIANILLVIVQAAI